MADDKTYLKYLRAILLFLVFFDLAIAIPALFFPNWIVNLGNLNSDSVTGAMYRSGTIEPFFVRGIGVFWLFASYVQYVAWRDPANRLLTVNTAIVFRVMGATFELTVMLFLLPRVDFSQAIVTWTLIVFVTGDYLLVAAMVYLLHKLDLKWWRIAPAENEVD